MQQKTLTIKWRGTIGLGDCMMALNCAHHHAWHTGYKIKLIMHWDHDADYLHHFEEEETIVDRMQYIHKFYLHRDQVSIFHEFNHRGDFYYDPEEVDILENKNRYEFEDHRYHNVKGKVPPNLWTFDERLTSAKKYIDMRLITRNMKKKKVVVWRPLHNAEPPRPWKRRLTNDDWDVIITKLRRAGLHVVELTYRTPIREAMFHLQTCRMSLSYDGMYHYVSRNLCLPMAVVSDAAITKYHTPIKYCLKLSSSRKNSKNIWDSTAKSNIANFLGDTKKKSIVHRADLNEFYNHNSYEESMKDKVRIWKRFDKGPTLLDKDHRKLQKKKKRK